MARYVIKAQGVNVIRDDFEILAAKRIDEMWDIELFLVDDPDLLSLYFEEAVSDEYFGAENYIPAKVSMLLADDIVGIISIWFRNNISTLEFTLCEKEWGLDRKVEVILRLQNGKTFGLKVPAKELREKGIIA